MCPIRWSQGVKRFGSSLPHTFDCHTGAMKTAGSPDVTNTTIFSFLRQAELVKRDSSCRSGSAPSPICNEQYWIDCRAEMFMSLLTSRRLRMPAPRDSHVNRQLGSRSGTSVIALNRPGELPSKSEGMVSCVKGSCEVLTISSCERCVKVCAVQAWIGICSKGYVF